MLRRRLWVPLVWVVSLVVVGGVVWLAARATFMPPRVSQDQLPAATFVVADASIGASLPVSVSVSWGTQPLAAGSLSGMVTAISLPDSGVIDAGDVLLSVDLRPVVVMQGSVPGFRDLSVGVSGDDVRQLQTFLNAKGFLKTQPDGKFQASTAAAVRAWQAMLGVTRTGVVRAGDVLFVASLPAHVVFNDGVVVGAVITPGQPIVSVVDDAPTFQAMIGSNMSSGVTPKTGQQASVMSPDGGVTWDASVTQVTSGATGGFTVTLESPSGGPVCGGQCDLLTYTPGGLMVNGMLIVSPTVSGPAVPLAAVGTAPDGSRFVVRADGTRVTVDVRGGDGSRLIVDGVQAGDVVQLFAETTG